MAHDTTICVTVACDRCLVAAHRPDDPTGQTAHWSSLDEALQELTAPAWGWAASHDVQICARRVAALTCQNHGHQWGEWQSASPLGRDDLGIRLCARCGVDEVVPWTRAVS